MDINHRLDEVILEKLRKNPQSKCIWWDGKWYSNQEVFDLIEFPPLPDWLYPWENFRELIEQAANTILDTRLRPEVIKILEELLPGAIYGGSHIILDRLPTQAQIDTFPEGAAVHVYNPDIVFEPSS